MDAEYFLNGFWRFCPDPENLGIQQQWMLQENQPYLEEKTRIIVPSCWNRKSWQYSDYLGVAWYWRMFRVPPQCHDRPTFLLFEGVAHSATIFIDGDEIGKFEGGGLPFEMDISRFIDNQDHFMAVRVDASPSSSRYPLISEVDYYGGIFRDVKIISKELVLIEDRSIETILNYQTDGKSVRYAELTLSMFLRNRADFDIKANLSIEISRDYVPVVEITKNLEILKQNSRLSKTLIHIDGEDFDLWTPEDPTLYNFIIRIYNEELGEILKIEDVMGIREIEIDNNAIKLNGQTLNLKGAIVPIDTPNFGYSLPITYIYDMLLDVKNQGFNIIRPNQGVFDRYFIELASRIGLLVINDVPLISLSVIEKQAYFNLFAAGITFLPALAVYSVNLKIDQADPKVNRPLVELQKLFSNRLDPSRYMIPTDNFGVDGWSPYLPQNSTPKPDQPA